MPIWLSLSYTLRKLVWAYLESRKLFILNLRKMLGSQFYYPVYSLVLSLGLLLAYLKNMETVIFMKYTKIYLVAL
ncbi:Uncharacterised protein [Streptococcus pneumoniae]|nr:Uncharacterised protein [Streptococcus pneumoniae]CKH15391.1 Uncharacterised protein [Streptococcus pneumoniae]